MGMLAIVIAAFIVSTLLSGACLWLAMKIIRFNGTFIAAASIAAISSLVGFLPVVGTILSAVVMFVLICKWTDAEFLPDAVLMVLVSGAIAWGARAVIYGILT